MSSQNAGNWVLFLKMFYPHSPPEAVGQHMHRLEDQPTATVGIG